MVDNINQGPEDKARDNIDRKLIASGWDIQDKNKINWNASASIAIRRYNTQDVLFERLGTLVAFVA